MQKEHKIHLYVDSEFINTLDNEIKKPIKDFKKGNVANSKILVWQLYYLINESEDVIKHLDNISKKTNPNVKALIKNPKKKSRRKQSIDNNQDYNKLNPNSVFLSSKNSQICEELSEKYGYIHISKDNFDKAQILFSHNLVAIDEANNWDFMEQHKHPCNSMIIADNYLLSTSDNNNELEPVNNLLSILMQLLPDKLEITFQLLLVTERGVQRDNEAIILKLNEEVKQLFPKLKIAIKIETVDGVHDRNILTNFYWFSSGYGFKPYKGSTNFFAYPITYAKQEIQTWYYNKNPIGHSAWKCYNHLRQDFFKLSGYNKKLNKLFEQSS
mgnify:CR=1 FL=1